MLSLRHAAVFIGPLLVACGDDSTTNPDESEPETAGATVSGGVGPGPGGEACSGLSFSCPAGFCNTQQQCGEGVCLPAPTACSGACTGACGCDGTFYCNACVAHFNGADVDVGATCSAPPPFDSLFTLGPEPLRLLFLQFDPGADICVQVMLRPDDSGLEFDATITAPWSIESAVVSDRALDCNLQVGCLPVLPSGEITEAVGVSGFVEISDRDPSFPVALSAEITVQLPASSGIEARTLVIPFQAPPLCF